MDRRSRSGDGTVGNGSVEVLLLLGRLVLDPLLDIEVLLDESGRSPSGDAEGEKKGRSRSAKDERRSRRVE